MSSQSVSTFHARDYGELPVTEHHADMETRDDLFADIDLRRFAG